MSSMTKDEFSLGGPVEVPARNQAQLNATLPAPTSTGTGVVGLHPDRLREIGEDAARAAAIPFNDVSVTMERDSADEPAYFFSYSVPPGRTTGEMRLRLMRELRDRLLASGDPLYPYVRLKSL